MAFKDVHEFRGRMKQRRPMGPDEPDVMVAMHSGATKASRVPFQMSFRLRYDFTISTLGWEERELLLVSYDPDSRIFRLEKYQYGRIRMYGAPAGRNPKSPFRVRFLIGDLPLRHVSIPQIETAYEVKAGALYVDVPDLFIPETKQATVAEQRPTRPVRPLTPHWKRPG